MFRCNDLVFYVMSTGSPPPQDRFIGIIVGSKYDHSYEEEVFDIRWWCNGKRWTRSDGIFLRSLFLIPIGHIEPNTLDIEVLYDD